MSRHTQALQVPHTGLLRLVSRVVPLRLGFGRPITLFPSESADNVLADFVESVEPWSSQRVPLPRRLCGALWALITIELAWGIWLVTIVTGVAPCDGLICAVTTLGHVRVLLICTVICVAGLVGLVPSTRGLSKCNGRQVAGVAIASASGAVALLGIAALLVSAVIGLILLMAILMIVFAFAETS
jgi:hypothetical protein